MNRAELEREVAAVGWWWHTIDLGQGVVTPGAGACRELLAVLSMPEDLRGKSVLDVGANDGFFSFEAERREAARVVAVDAPDWGSAGWGTRRKAGFDLARRALGSKVEDREMDVLDLSPRSVGVFDLVLFLGVLYHLRHPLLALERIHSVAADQVIVETLVDLLRVRRPALAFYPGAEASDDPTNWWGPNPAAVAAMLRAAGFSRVEILAVRREPRRILARALRRALGDPAVRRQPVTFLAGLAQRLRRGRAILHAWR